MKHLKRFIFVVLTLVSITLQAQPPAPATVTAAIGTPAHGISHYLTITWTTSTGATGYELEASTNGSAWTNIYTGTSLTYSHNTGNVADATYYYRVRATNGTYSAYTNATQYPIRTACDVPAVPQFTAVTTNSLTMNIATEMPDANPGTTTYSIYCTTTSQYVQANGTLGASEIFQTKAAWGSLLLSGLTASTNYCFYAKARNSDGYITIAQGASLTSTETFTTANNWATLNNPTNVYYSPQSCTTGGLSYIASGGCTGGYIGKTAAWNNFFGCYLRTPATNCTGNTTAVVNFDLSNSYFASQPNDKIRFYMWVDNGYKDASAVKINGTSVGVIEGGDMVLKFSQARTCVNVSVEFDLTTSSNLSNILFYIEPSCGYNNSNVFSVGIDNVTIQSQSAPTGCVTTNACAAATIQSATGNTAVCAGQPTNFSVTTAGSVASYLWQVSTDGGGSWNAATGAPYSNGTTAQLSISSVTGLNGYRYRCNVTGTCSGTPVSQAAILTVNSLPGTPGTINGNATACQNQSGVAYSVSAVSGATGYTWTLPSGASIASGSNTSSITVNYSTAQSGSITVAATNGCGTGTSSAPLAITINTLPATPASITGSTSYCPGVQQAYSVAQVNGATSYTWTLPNGWTGSSTNTSINATPNGNGGTISVTANNACGSSSAASLVANTSGAPVQPDAISGLTAVCTGDTITYSVTVVSGASAYVWTLPNGWSGTSTTSNITVVAGANAGSVSVASQNGCGTSTPQSASISIKSVPALPVVTGAGAVCEGTINTYTFNNDPNAIGYSVTVPSGWNYTSGQNSASVTVGAQSGNIVVVANNECGSSAAATTTVTVLPAPNVQFNAPVTPVCSTAAPIQLSATPTGGTFSGTAVGGGFFNPSLAPVGSNQIVYTYTDANTCTDADTVVVVTTICSGINEAQNLVSVYPNPFNTFINVTTQGVTNADAIVVRDVTGRTIAIENISSSNTVLQMPKGTAAGIYLLQVLSTKGEVLASKKVVLAD